MTAYIVRWAEIYVTNRLFLRMIPHWVFTFVGAVGRRRSERRLHCRFPDIETAVARLAPRPWLQIHGERDAYIGPAIALALFKQARQPKEMWLVPGAKHNRCRECEPEAYATRLQDFLARYAPRRPLPPQEPPAVLPTFPDQQHHLSPFETELVPVPVDLVDGVAAPISS
jgi:hypothetical protein